jgi:hypothetical protein
MMGFITDNTRTRFGRRRPYFLVGTFLIFIAFFALWYPVIFPDCEVEDLIESRKILERSIAYLVFKYLEMKEICTRFNTAIQNKDYLFTNTYNRKTLENHENILKALKEKDLNKLLKYIDLHYDTIIEGLKN